MFLSFFSVRPLSFNAKTKLSFEFLELCSPGDREPGLRWTRSLSLTPSFPRLERGLQLKFMRGCLPPGKCYAAVITYILAGLYEKSRTERPLAAFNHHYTLTRFLRFARFSSLLNPCSPRIKAKICTRQSGRESRPIAIHENRCSFYNRSEKLETSTGDFHWTLFSFKTDWSMDVCFLILGTIGHFC